MIDAKLNPNDVVSKSIGAVAEEVIKGLWGNGNDRKKRLTASGYNYEQVQAAVNAIVKGQKPSPAPAPKKKTNEEIAKEVIAGKWGNGAERKSNLENAGYNYSEIQAKVNEKLKKPTATPKPTPSVQKPTAPTTNYFPKYSGKSNSLVDALKSLGINSALSYRGKIAQANGIVKKSALYIGLKSHNEKMLNLLKQGKLIKP